MEEIQTQTQLDTKSCEQEWRDFFQTNGDRLFQIAILLTADPLIAEAALIEGIDWLDLDRPAAEAGLAAWERGVVLRSISVSELSSSIARPLARSMLQRGLWPVLEIERLPRVCFVLKMLLGYPSDLCAKILGIEESGILMLLQTAVIQLHRKASEQRLDLKKNTVQ